MFSRQEGEVRKNDNRIGDAAVSDRYPKPNYLQSYHLIIVILS